jgi:hypothetical protein
MSEDATLAERLRVLYDAHHPSNCGGERAWFLRKYREAGHEVADSTFFDWIARNRVPNKHWPAFNEVLGDLVMEATEKLHATILELDDVL